MKIPTDFPEELVLETPLERVLKIVNNHFIVIVQARYFV